MFDNHDNLDQYKNHFVAQVFSLELGLVRILNINIREATLRMGLNDWRSTLKRRRGESYSLMQVRKKDEETK